MSHFTCQHRHSFQSGFTLVEMLVVVAIIAVLISILLPSFWRARAAARIVVCGNNLHHLGLAHEMYQMDYNRFLAHSTIAEYSGGGQGLYWGWANKLAPYVGYSYTAFNVFEKVARPNLPGQRGNVFTCPEAPDGSPGGCSSFAVSAYLGALGGSGLSICIYPAYRLSKFETPSGKAFLFDGSGWRTRINEFASVYTAGNTPQLTLRHPDTSANVLFLDGHVKCYKSPPLPSYMDINLTHSDNAYNWLVPGYPPAVSQ